MPGKYPTINSPLTTRTTLTAGGTPGLSNSDKASLAQMFPNSPIYSTTEADYRKLAQSLLMPSFQTGDAAHFPAGVNMDYQDSPDLSVPPTGFDTSYYPNLIANPDPAATADGTATGLPLTPNDNFGTGATVDNVIPARTAAKIGSTSIDVSGPVGKLGQSEAHSINPGADGDPAT